MKNEDFSKKPLVEQIYNELFVNIEKHDEFDEETVKTLMELAMKGELKKSSKVMQTIKLTTAK